jgi:hypothetical protein
MGIFLLIFGVFLSMALKQPHFYTPFSIGLFFISFCTYNSLTKRGLFFRWNKYQHIIFWILLIVASFIIDRIGIFLGYWYYPHYFTFWDEVVKILFEYAVAFAYFMNIVLIGEKLLKKINAKIGLLFSLLFLAPTTLFFTEYINTFSNSWVVLMPKILWFTAGAWLMALVPICVYKITNEKLNIKNPQQ